MKVVTEVSNVGIVCEIIYRIYCLKWTTNFSHSSKRHLCKNFIYVSNQFEKVYVQPKSSQNTTTTINY